MKRFHIAMWRSIWLLLPMLVACVSPGPTPEQTAARERLAKAEAMFQERCKTAGEKIYRTAENVEGIFLMKIRPEGMNYGHTPEQQFRMDDPYGHDSTGDRYIKEFLYGRNANGYLTLEHTVTPGYRYVEAIDLQDGKRYRYTGAMKDVEHISSILIGGDGKKFVTRDFVLDKTPALGNTPRYGVTYYDLSTHEEREYWIAGSSLKVIDLRANEVMAERIGYMMDRGQGDNGGGRSPWLLAADHACPSFPKSANQTDQVDQSRVFVEKVLKPKQEN